MARSVANISLAQRHKALFIVSSQTSWLQTHLDRLRSRPAHGNRRLHLDQLFHGLLLLLAFFDPLARSLRRIEDARDFGGRIELNKLARSTTADALAVDVIPTHSRRCRR